MTNPTGVARIDVAQLGILGELGDAGQGKVYRVTVPYVAQPMAYKEYSPAVAARVDWSAVEGLIRVYGAADPATRAWLWQYTAWPTTMVTRLGERTGILLPMAPPECTVPLTIGGVTRPTLLGLDHLLNPPAYMASNGLNVTLQHRVQLVREVAAVMTWMHRNDIAIGDLSPKVVVVSLWPKPSCFLLDCDAVRHAGATVLDQTQTPGWELPDGEDLATRAGDSYKLALIGLRVLASNRTTRDLSLLPPSLPELTALIARTLAAEPAQRPGATEWLAVLDRAVPLAAYVPPPPPQPWGSAGYGQVSAPPAYGPPVSAPPGFGPPISAPAIPMPPVPMPPVPMPPVPMPPVPMPPVPAPFAPGPSGYAPVPPVPGSSRVGPSRVGPSGVGPGYMAAPPPDAPTVPGAEAATVSAPAGPTAVVPEQPMPVPASSLADPETVTGEAPSPEASPTEPPSAGLIATDTTASSLPLWVTRTPDGQTVMSATRPGPAGDEPTSTGSVPTVDRSLDVASVETDPTGSPLDPSAATAGVAPADEPLDPSDSTELAAAGSVESTADPASVAAPLDLPGVTAGPADGADGSLGVPPVPAPGSDGTTPVAPDEADATTTQTAATVAAPSVPVEPRQAAVTAPAHSSNAPTIPAWTPAPPPDPDALPSFAVPVVPVPAFADLTTAPVPGASGYAPPVPTAPGYAQPVSAAPVSSGSGYLQPGYAQPGYSQPGYSQPGYGQPGYPPGGSGPSGGVPGSPSPWPGPEPRNRARIWIAIAAALVGVLVLGGGAYLVVQRLDRHDTVTAPPVNSNQPSSPTLSTPTAPSTSDTPSAEPTDTEPTPIPSATVGIVDYAAVATTDPRAPDVASLFNQYFMAIDSRDYSQVLASYDPNSEIGKSDSAGIAQFEQGISTSTDSNIALTGLSNGSGNIAVMARITFQSAQAAGLGPARDPNETCTRWERHLFADPAQPGAVPDLYRSRQLQRPLLTAPHLSGPPDQTGRTPPRRRPRARGRGTDGRRRVACQPRERRAQPGAPVRVRAWIVGFSDGSGEWPEWLGGLAGRPGLVWSRWVFALVRAVVWRDPAAVVGCTGTATAGGRRDRVAPTRPPAVLQARARNGRRVAGVRAAQGVQALPRRHRGREPGGGALRIRGNRGILGCFRPVGPIPDRPRPACERPKTARYGGIRPVLAIQQVVTKSCLFKTPPISCGKVVALVTVSALRRARPYHGRVSQTLRVSNRHRRGAPADTGNSVPERMDTCPQSTTGRSRR